MNVVAVAEQLRGTLVLLADSTHHPKSRPHGESFAPSRAGGRIASSNIAGSTDFLRQKLEEVAIAFKVQNAKTESGKVERVPLRIEPRCEVVGSLMRQGAKGRREQQVTAVFQEPLELT